MYMRMDHILRPFSISLRKGRRGFSLMEVVIGAGLLGLAVASSFRVYVSNQRLTRYLDQRARAYQIAVQEIEGLRRMQYHHILWLIPTNHIYTSYAYKFRGYDSNGNPVRGEDAIVEVKGHQTLGGKLDRYFSAVDPYKKEHFDPMGLEEGWVYIYLCKTKTEAGPKRDWAVRVKVVVCWRDGDIVYGGDKNLNGNLDKCERDKCIGPNNYVPYWAQNYYEGKNWEYWPVDWLGENHWNRTFKSPVEIETVLAPVL